MLWQYIRIIWQSETINCSILSILSTIKFKQTKISSHSATALHCTVLSLILRGDMRASCSIEHCLQDQVMHPDDTSSSKTRLLLNWTKTKISFLQWLSYSTLHHTTLCYADISFRYHLPHPSGYDNCCSFKWCMELQYNWCINSRFLIYY